MIDTIIFDMDGVLIDAREWHYDALNRALGLFGHEISRADHLSTFDGLPTRRKLEMLSLTDDLPIGLHGFINKLKQRYTMEIVYARCRPVFAQEFALSKLRSDGYRLGVASNSVRATVATMMEMSGLAPYLDAQLSNEDVTRPKPHPEIYYSAMGLLEAIPENTLVVEDNENGIAAARAAGAHVMVVECPTDVTYARICGEIRRTGPES